MYISQAVFLYFATYWLRWLEKDYIIMGKLWLPVAGKNDAADNSSRTSGNVLKSHLPLASETLPYPEDIDIATRYIKNTKL